MIDPGVREQMLAPPPASTLLPGIGGSIKHRCEDFVVDEIPAYGADGREDRHLLLRVRKRGMSTPEMLKILARDLALQPHEIGCAGRKDREAVTTQWLSVPIASASQLEAVSIDGFEILESHPHGQKLRTGHLHGNQFAIVIREPGIDAATAVQRVRDKAMFIESSGGLENVFGEQRFGHDGGNIEDGLAFLQAGKRLGPKAKFLVSALQSALFNLYVVLRKEQGWLRQVLPGDMLQRRESGGMFRVEDASVEQLRMDRGELVVSGPIFGAKMRGPQEGSPAALLEQEVLRRAGLDPEVFARAGGKRLPGTRRPVQVPVMDFSASEAAAVDGLPEGVQLRFSLPAGSYATRLITELQCGT